MLDEPKMSRSATPAVQAVQAVPSTSRHQSACPSHTHTHYNTNNTRARAHTHTHISTHTHTHTERKGTKVGLTNSAIGRHSLAVGLRAGGDDSVDDGGLLRRCKRLRRHVNVKGRKVLCHALPNEGNLALLI